MTNVRWLKHYIGMITDPKFADIIGEHGFKGMGAVIVFVIIFEDTATTAGVFAMSKSMPHTIHSMRSKFSILYPHMTDKDIQWSIDILVEKEILDNKDGFIRIVNFEKYQHEYLSTSRVRKHRHKEKHEGMVTEVVQYLNATKAKMGFKTGTSYSPKTTSYRESIGARLDDGYSMEEIKNVITFKCYDWQNTEWEKHLTPSTLFRPGHFDKYLNQVPPNWDNNVKEKKMVNVRTMNGNKATISREEYEKAAEGFYTIIKEY